MRRSYIYACNGSEGDDYYASACGERKGGGEKGMKGGVREG